MNIKYSNVWITCLFDVNLSREEVYNILTKPVVNNVLEGYNSEKNTKFIIRTSYLKIYNEMISGLLKPNNINQNLNKNENKKKGLYADNLSE